MDEGGKDQGGKHQEVKARTEDFFPLKKRFVLEAFKNLDSSDNSDDVKKAVDEEIGILGRTNVYASISFGDLLEPNRETVITQMRRGIAICHQALRLGANRKLPKFTEEFVQKYDEEQNEKVGEYLNREQLDHYQHQAELAIKQRNVKNFREFEPEISKIVENKLRARSKSWQPEQDRIYAGFMDTYFLFREGCGDSKNFQQVPR